MMKVLAGGAFAKINRPRKLLINCISVDWILKMTNKSRMIKERESEGLYVFTVYWIRIIAKLKMINEKILWGFCQNHWSNPLNLLYQTTLKTSQYTIVAEKWDNIGLTYPYHKYSVYFSFIFFSAWRQSPIMAIMVNIEEIKSKHTTLVLN